MKILQICNKVPYPPRDGGAIAMLSLSRSLAAEGHEVVILAMNTEKHHSSPDQIPAGLTSHIRFLYVNTDTRIRLVPLLFNLLFSNLPYNAIRFDLPLFRERLIEILINESFDIVQLEGLYLKPYMEVIRHYHHGKIVYRAHNIESDIWLHLAIQTKNPFKRFYFNILAHRIYRYEKDFMNQYDVLLPITDTDANTFRELGNSKPAEIIPSGIPDEDLREESTEPDPYSLFYIGALDWIPNQEGLIWFIDKVWRNIKKQQPRFTFHVAGRNAPVWIEEKCINNNIVFHGEVTDSLRFIDEHGIMIVPLFAGSGLRVKIIEAMARSKVIITTTLGAHGIKIEHGKHVLISDEATEMSNLIIQLPSNLELIYTLKKNSYLFIRDHFTDRNIVKKLLSVYQL